MMAKDMEDFPSTSGAVLELEPNEVTRFRGRTATQLDSESRRVVGFGYGKLVEKQLLKRVRTDGLELGMIFDDLKLVKQRDEWLVSCLDE